MKIAQRKWTAGPAAPASFVDVPPLHPQLVLVFGSRAQLGQPEQLAAIKEQYPDAHLLGCSTAGEISDTQVADDTLMVTAIEFEHTQVHGAKVKLTAGASSFAAGKELAETLPPTLPGKRGAASDPLKHVFVLSDGLNVNGSDLVRGLMQHLPDGVTITGGLAGDGARFGQTLVFWDGPPEPGVIAVVGFYSRRLQVGFGSKGGWDSFGPDRLITRSQGNVLYELDGQSALGLYKRYLGGHVANLPAAGLLFPLSLRSRTGDTAVVRTILSVNERDQSMTFAGDVPENYYARLMKANFDRLIDGAADAARTSLQSLGPSPARLAILISCVGRKLVLHQRVEEELEGVREALGPGPVLTGFYSYGEISPFAPGARCELHNQTMTITTLAES
ncbi:MAG TPA: FIST N-terminal domain-containing protein [Dongiaceae bacterium]|jgi:hypothetical protein|nr:FIST N-terminal domain-containing protein [Dongiaceae bacterium]